MPRDKQFKEGVDYEWRQIPGSNALSRHFFTKKEKLQRQAADQAAKPKKKSTPKRAKETVSPLSKPSPVSTKKLPPKGAEKLVRDVEAALERDVQRERMEGFEPPTKPKRKSRKRVPGKALAQAFSNAMSGEGETNPGLIVRNGDTRSRTDSLLRSPSRTQGSAGRRQRRSGYAKGGLVKANCGASVKPRGSK